MACVTYTAKRELVNDNAPFVALFNDLGNGQVDTTLLHGTGVATFVRTTAAAARLPSGLWKLDVASGVPRSHYLTDLSYGGYLAEGLATQLITPSAAVRDMTNAAWVKASMTAAKTSIGIDGVASACTRLTATGANGTALFTLTAAASSRTYSCFIKRITGTGNVQLTQDNGGTWTTVALPLSGFNLVQLSASVLNAVFGIRLVTNGDAIDVDCNQFEAGAFATTPIPAAGTRNADVLTYPAAGNSAFASGSLYCECVVGNISRQSIAIRTWAYTDAGLNSGYSLEPNNGSNVPQMFSGGLGVTTNAVGSTSSATIRKLAGTYAANDIGIFANGAKDGTSSVATMPSSNATTIKIGGGGEGELFGTVKNVRIYQSRLSDATVQQMTALSADYAHLSGRSYNLEFKAEQVDRKVKVKRSTQQPIGGGAPETLLNRQEATVDVLTEVLSEASLVPQFREFLASVSAGEVFTFDRYGTVAAPVDPRQAILESSDYAEQRVMTTLQQRLAFTVRLLT